MNLKLFINKVFKIVFSPSEKWKKYSFEDKKNGKYLRQSLAISLFLVFIARLFGTTMTYLPSSGIEYIIVYSVVFSIVDIVCFLLFSFILHKILPYYGIVFSLARVKILVYVSLIPFYFSSIIINLFPSLFFVWAVSLYSLYIFYWGIINYLKLNKKNILVFYIVSIILLIGLYMLLYVSCINIPIFDFIS